jgi:hypothetical protein
VVGLGTYALVSKTPVLLDEARVRSPARKTKTPGGKLLRTDIPMSEVEKHNSPHEGDLWVVINQEVWDLSEVRPVSGPVRRDETRSSRLTSSSLLTFSTLA